MVGLNKPAAKIGERHGSESRWRSVLICARRDTATCGQDSPAPSIHLRPRPASRNRLAIPAAEQISMWDEHNTRKPRLLLRLSGWLLLRADARTLSGLLFQEPPRSTRTSSQGTPQKTAFCQ
ncbi:MAG: hypothetical protein V9E86_06245 [Nitrosomonas sp.]